ncbi:MAG: metal-sulfur cluster assembly factor [Chloroflexi bacterium]|nr:metal-sulfur cluster assembly factor [Chloroflexota bacterium]
MQGLSREGPPWDALEGEVPLPDPTADATPDDILEALRSVYDPEIGVNIVDLGLVYDVERSSAGEVKITMTLTSPACPLGPVIMDQVSYVAGRLPGVENATVEFIWTPPWDPRVMASEEAKAELGIW